MTTIEQQLEAVVDAGRFGDRRQVMNRAIQALFAVQPDLRAEAALELFQRDEVSLLRAAEMAGLDFESFRLLLQARGIAWQVQADSAEAMDQSIQAFFKDAV